jgi:hypothetical protein
MASQLGGSSTSGTLPAIACARTGFDLGNGPPACCFP